MLSISLECQLESIQTKTLTEATTKNNLLVSRDVHHKQLTKRDHHKEQDVQTSCTRSSVSSPKNDKNLIQEVTVSILIIIF